MSKLHIDSVTKTYDNSPILSDIYISCKTGGIIGLIGRNGSGKSTLLKIVFGSVKSESKFVRIGHKVIKNIVDTKDLINYLPQENFLPNNISVKSLINLFLTEKNRKKVLKNEYVKPLLNKKNQDLSGGEKRIVEILLIIHSSAKFALLDEPFNGLSPIAREYIIDYIRTTKSSKGYIITDHDYENVMSIADSIVYLENGSLQQVKDKCDLEELGYIPKTSYNNIRT